MDTLILANAMLFLSTLSLRRATVILSLMGNLLLYFYPRSPCGERPRPTANNEATMNISIHALLAESDAADIS